MVLIDLAMEALGDMDLVVIMEAGEIDMLSAEILTCITDGDGAMVTVFITMVIIMMVITRIVIGKIKQTLLFVVDAQ